MPTWVVPLAVPKGVRLDSLVGRSWAIPVLLLVNDRPGIGVWQAADLLQAHPLTITRCVEHLEEVGLAKVDRNVEGRGSNKTRVTLTDDGLRVARELTTVVDRLHPDEDATPPAVVLPRGHSVLDRPGAREALLALRERKRLTTPQYEDAVRGSLGNSQDFQFNARLLRLALHEVGLVDWTIEGGAEDERRILWLTKQGKKIADELARIAALEREREERMAKLSGEIEESHR